MGKTPFRFCSELMLDRCAFRDDKQPPANRHPPREDRAGRLARRICSHAILWTPRRRCGCGEIGIRGGLKIHWGFPRCRFESDQPHHFSFRPHLVLLAKYRIQADCLPGSLFLGIPHASQTLINDRAHPPLYLRHAAQERTLQSRRGTIGWNIRSLPSQLSDKIVAATRASMPRGA